MAVMPTVRSKTYATIDAMPILAGLLAVWAVLSWLVFPPVNWWLVAYVAPAPLVLVAARGQSVRVVALLTYLAGLVWWAVAVRWLTDVTLGGYIALSFYLAVYPLTFALVLRLVHRRLGLPLFLAAPIVWVAVELLRGLMLTGFPWFLLGHSQPTAMIQVADAVGAYGVSFVVAVSAGLVVDLLTMPLTRPGRRLNPTLALGLGLWAVVTFGALGYGLWRLNQDATTGPALRVAVVQTDVPQSNKIAPTDEQDAENFDRMMALSEQAMAAGPGLIVWPETAVPRPINDESYRVFRYVGHGAQWRSYRDRLARFAADHQTALIVGAHAITGWSRQSDPSGGEYFMPGRRYNAAYLVDPLAGVAARYDKVHRVPFGEYVLFEQALPWLAAGLRELAPVPGYSLSPGEQFTLLSIEVDGRTWRIGAPICFEDVISYPCRAMVYDARGNKRADLLVNLTNDGWYPGSSEAIQHEQIARFRCVENRVPMARAVNRGVSGLFDACGRPVEKLVVDGRRQLVAGTASAELHADRRATLFGRVGDLFAEACGALTIGLLVLSAVFKRKAVQDR